MKGGGIKSSMATTSEMQDSLAYKTYGYPGGTSSAAEASQYTTDQNNQTQSNMNSTFTGGIKKSMRKKHTRKKHTRKKHTRKKFTKKHKSNHFYLLTYTFYPNIDAERKKIRKSHLELCKHFEKNNTLVLGGPFPLKDTNAKHDLFVFKTKKAASEFKSKDPNFKNGLIKKFKITKWPATVGVLINSHSLKGGKSSSMSTTTAVTFDGVASSGASASPTNATSTAVNSQTLAMQANANAQYDNCVGKSSGSC